MIFQSQVAQDFKSDPAFAYWTLVREPGDGKKSLKLRYMESDVYLKVPGEIPFESSVKDPQDYFTSLVCGLTSVNIQSVIEHDHNSSITVPEPPYYATEVQGLRMETETDPEAAGSKTPSTKSPQKVKHEPLADDSQFKTPTPKKKNRVSVTPPSGRGSPEA